VSRKYVIIDADFVPSVVFSQVLETSADTLRWNNDETKTFVKYDGSKPSFLTGKDTLTHSQILSELEKDEWQVDLPWE